MVARSKRGSGKKRGSQKPLPAPPDVAAVPADAQKTKSGLASKVLQPGTSKDKPKTWDKVTVTISTHSEGGLTGADFELAAEIDSRYPND